MGSRYSVVIANVSGRDLVGFVEEAKALVAQQVELPNGYRISWGGQFENQQRAAARLSIVVPVALGLIFVLLFSTFGSVRQALLILSNIPFALVGGIVALWVTGEYLSVPASVGSSLCWVSQCSTASCWSATSTSCMAKACHCGKWCSRAPVAGYARY
jgi:cobalt-zinc-cadmium resistance protein CzcA